MRVRVLTPARDEFVAAAMFYEREAAGLGGEFIEEYERALEMIASNPHLGPHFEGESRRKLMRPFPIHIV